MKIISTTVMRGPNYWSVYRKKLIVMKLDIGELEDRPTNTIPGFREELQRIVPSLYTHRCSEDYEGGFFQRVDEGTWMGHVVEHVALELQTLAGLDTGFGRTRSTSVRGVYNVVYSYLEEKTGIYAGEIAVELCDAIVAGNDYDLAPHIQRMKEIRERERLGPSTGSIVEEAVKRNIPYIRLNRRSLVQLGEWKTRVEKITSIPLSLNGRAEVMIKNILPAVLAATISKFKIEDIREGLRSFIPSSEFTPGRFNIFKFDYHEVMVDYAHNADGYEQLKKFLDKTDATRKIGIVGATGDRKDSDIKNVGRYAAMMFDEIVIRHDKDLRGCPVEKSNALIMEGIKEIDPSIPVTIISDEIEAVEFLLNTAPAGSFIVLCADKVMHVLEHLNQKMNNREEYKTSWEFLIGRAS